MSVGAPTLPPNESMPTAAEIFGRRPASTPWPSSRAGIALGIELLPTIADDLTADLVEYLLLALVDRCDELRAVRSMPAAALAQSHTQHVEIIRLRRRLADVLDARRLGRTAA